jgi:hypothetical protein
VGSLLDQAMGLLRSHDIDGLASGIGTSGGQRGVGNRFVTALLAPLNAMVGDAWMRAEIQAFEEHLYTECATGVLRQAIHQLNGHARQRQPRVLLTTFPQEEHAVGLLMAEKYFDVAGLPLLAHGGQNPLE